MPAQAEMPGMERPKIKAIEEAAINYKRTRDRRMKLTEEEISTRQNLLDVLHKHLEKLTPNAAGEYHYRLDDDEEVVLLPGKEKVKVRSILQDEGGQED